MADEKKYIGADRLKEIFQYIKGEIESRVGISKWSQVEEKPFETIDEKTLSVDENGNLYAKKQGTDVSVKQIITSGTKVAEVNVDGIQTDIFAPDSVDISKKDGNQIIQENDGIYVAPVKIISADEETIVNNNDIISVNTNVIATHEEIIDVNASIEAVDVSVPDFIEYEEEELYEMAWSLLQFDEKPEYTEADLDEILDQIDFSGGGGSGAKEMTNEVMMSIWNEVFGE